MGATFFLEVREMTVIYEYIGNKNYTKIVLYPKFPNTKDDNHNLY